MDTFGFDTVARHIPLYRERLLALPGGPALPAPWYRLAVQPLYLVVLLPLAWRWYVRRQVR